MSGNASTETGSRKSKRRRMRSVRLSGDMDDSVRGRESDRDRKRSQPSASVVAPPADPAVARDSCSYPSTSGMACL